MRTSRIPVLLPDANDTLALKIVRLLGRSGRFRVDLLARSPQASARYSRHAERTHLARFTPGGTDHLVALQEVLARDPPAVLLPVSLPDWMLAARHRASLAVQVALPPLAAPEDIASIHDKILLTARARALGLAVPESIAVTSDLDPGALPYPLLLKPATSHAGRGMERIANLAALRAALVRRAGERLLAQRYLEGSDVGVNVLCRDGVILAHTIQHAIGPPASPFGPATAWALEPDDEALDLVRRLLGALRWSGVANIDLRRESATGRVYLLEVNPRFWWSVAGSARAGVNFPELACLAALGEPLPTPRPRPVRYRVFSWRDVLCDPRPTLLHHAWRLRRRDRPSKP